MSANQFEAGFVVIERDARPLPLVVARLASFAKLPLMGIVATMAGNALLRRQLAAVLYEQRALMAVLAFHFRVRELQWILGCPGVIKRRWFPAFVVVASVAGPAKRSLVAVVGTVALDAHCRQFCLEAILVATAAHRRLVFVVERKFCVPVVIETGIGPAGFLVATLAFVAKRAFVRIVLQVTGYASGRKLVRIQRPTVAGIALCGGVLAQQRIAGLARVIELALPVFRRMAGLAFLAIAAFVGVVLAVAGDAGARRILESVIGVTRFALGRRVLSGERETGLAVIKFRFLPRFLVMAVVALVAEIAFVFVVLAMATDAG